jgi:hypothetical protein
VRAGSIVDQLATYSVLGAGDPDLPIKWVRLRSPISAGVLLASRMPAGLRLRSIIDVEEP